MSKLGFTFNGKHSSDYGLLMRSKGRSLLPSLRQRVVKIPGQQGSFDMGNNTYSNALISLECNYISKSFEEMRILSRNIALWLSEKGELVFDDEPDKKYYGRIYNRVELVNSYRQGNFSLVFEVKPFATGPEVTVTKQITQNLETVDIDYKGTAPTGVRITITNNGTNTVNGFTLTYGKISN